MTLLFPLLLQFVFVMFAMFVIVFISLAFFRAPPLYFLLFFLWTFTIARCLCLLSVFSSLFFLFQASSIELEECNSTSNGATLGGAVYMSRSNLEMSKCIFDGDKV